MAKLYFWYWAMSSWKSIELIKAAYNYKNRWMTPLVFNFLMDKRFWSGIVASRSGMSMDSTWFSKDTNFSDQIEEFIISNEWKSPDCLFIDEAQFLSINQVEELAKLAIFKDIPVMCYWLKTNFKWELFDWSKRLIELSQTIEEIKTICWCQKKATMNARINNWKMVDEWSEIEIGWDESYISLCLKHYMEGNLWSNN